MRPRHHNRRQQERLGDRAMHPTRSAVFLGGAICVLGLACGNSGDGGGSAPGGATGTGGSIGASGGRTGNGGSAGGGPATGGLAAGGLPGSGGLAAGGIAGTGGSDRGSGGVSADGGARSSGGAVGGSSGLGGGRDGGPALGGAGGQPGTGGRTGTDGGSAVGGTIGTGGVAGGGGTVGRGGSTGTGGASATGGRGGTGGATATGGTTNVGGTAGNSTLCPPGITKTISVAKDGSGQFTTVKAAVDSVAGTTDHVRIDIKAGTYTEKLTISSPKNLCLVGAGNTTTILSYGDSNASMGSTSGSASVHVSADDFSAANLAIQNTYGSGSQAVALRVTGDRQQFLNCRFVGYQDTLYTHNGMQYFRNCYVQGNTDYVFGGATAILQDCEVRNVEGGSAVTAPNTDSGTPYGIVFLGGQFTAVSSVKSGSVALGRPWGAAGFAAFLNLNLGGHISAAGFTSMSGNEPQNARFHEYQSTGAGASASSRSSYQLNASQAASYTLANILKGWTPSYSQ